MAGYQKKSSKNARLIALGFAAFILIYLFGQLWGFANLKLRTEQVDEDTIYDFVRAQGTVFRSEQLIEPVSASGVMVYNCADGDEVAMSEEVAAVYSDSTVSTVNNQLEQLQHELDSLTKAQTAKATRYTAVSNLSSEINDQAGKIVDFVQDGVVEGISDQKDELVSLLNRKKIALGQEESFEGRITELNAQISYLEQVKDQQRGVSVESPAAGYFCKEVDGYEEVFTAEALEDITYEGYQQLVSSQPQTVSDAVGKIVTTHVWYLGVDLDNTQAQKFELGDSVRLDFKFANGQTVTGEVVQIIPDNERSNTVVIFECKDVSDRMLKLRQQSVDVKRLTEELIAHYRALMLAALPGGQALLSGVSPEEEKLYLEKGPRMGQREASRAIRALGNALEHMTRGSDQRIELELALFSLSEPPQQVAVQAVPAARPAVPAQEAPRPFASAPVKPFVSAPAASAPVQEPSVEPAPMQQSEPEPAPQPVEPPKAEAAASAEEAAAPPQREAPPAPAQEVPAVQPQPEPKPEYTADPALNKPRKVAAEGINPFPQWAEVIKLLQEQDPMLYTYLKKSKGYFDGTRVLIDGGKTFRDFIRANKESQKLIKKLIAQVSGVAVPIGPYESKTVNRASANAEESLRKLEQLGLEVSIEDSERKKR